MNSTNSETASAENSNRNPKRIRSFPSDPQLELRLKDESARSGKSVSEVIRSALRMFFGV